jgi:hypothetical protein
MINDLTESQKNSNTYVICINRCISYPYTLNTLKQSNNRLTRSFFHDNTYVICIKALLLAASLTLLTSCKHSQHKEPPKQFTKPNLVSQIATDYGIPLPILTDLIRIESNFNPQAERFERKEYYRLKRHPSFKHYTDAQLIDLSTSYGLMQIMGYNAPDLNHPRQLLDPIINLTTGANFLKSLKHRCITWKAAVNAYNTGSCSKMNLAYLGKYFK